MNKSTLSWVDLYAPSSELIYENNELEFIIPENEQIFILDKYKNNVLFVTDNKQIGGGKYKWLGNLQGNDKKYLMKGGKNSIEAGFKILQTTSKKNKNIKVELINLKNLKKHIITFKKNIF